MGKGKRHGSFYSFLAYSTATHLQLTCPDPIGELLRVGTVLAGRETLYAVFYGSLEISDTLNNPFATIRSFK